MAEIIYGSELSKKIKAGIKEKVEQIVSQGKRTPTLAVVLVGDNPASLSYVKGKDKACHEVGFGSKMITLKEETTEAELKEVIDSLNQDETVDGILVQMPLPRHLDENKIILMIDPAKDVDGLHPVNVGNLYLGLDGFVPCTPLGIMEMIKEANVSFEGKNAVVIGRSKLVGTPVARLLMNENCTVTMCHSRTKDIEKICSEADILIAAIGKPKKVTKEWVKDGACVIDVGINRVDGKLVGDVDFEDVKDKAAVITPVPKGVGPMTITMLLSNTLKAYERKEKHS
ncbi:MAG: bifunctional methylenetetrahydrofolate dehydrogenase/methenyltetrahydrofolate cyclohydrolase FolD [Erysipelotrichaceae bacterium]|nr:bifunctional methylenetetrahydrofolate dehydrogenase/methenyltetrahydrofolate cyclohydrolase FolD [Erysipelotrichaceae bacterium]